jgi:hypothetical protein
MAPLTIDLGPGQTIMAASSFVQGAGSRTEGVASTGAGNPMQFAAGRSRTSRLIGAKRRARAKHAYNQSWSALSRKGGSPSIMLRSHKDHQ